MTDPERHAELVAVLLREMLACIEADPYEHIGAWRSEIQKALRLIDGLAIGGVVSREASEEIGRSIGQAGCVIQVPRNDGDPHG